MGQHFVSILTMLHIVNKKRPRINFGAVIYLLYVSAEAVKLCFTGILLMFDSKLFKILKIISENKKDPEGPFFI